MKGEDDKIVIVPEKGHLPKYKEASERQSLQTGSVGEAGLTQFLKIVQLTEQSRKIQLSFSNLVELTIRHLLNTETSPKEVIERLDAHIPEECCEASDLEDLFFRLVPHMSFFNPELLKMIIEQTGSTDLQGKLSEYDKEFELYCRNRISGPHPVIFSNEALNTDPLGERLLVKLDSEWEGLSLAEVKRFHCKIASILNVRQESLLLQSIQRGCVLYTFSIHNSVALRILKSRLTKHQETTLHETRVMSIVLGTKTLFQMNHSHALRRHQQVTADPKQDCSHASIVHLHVEYTEQSPVLLWSVLVYLLTVVAIANEFKVDVYSHQTLVRTRAA